MLDLFSTSVNHDDLVAAAPQVYELGDYSMEKLGVRQQASTQFDDQTHGRYPWQETLPESPRARPAGGRAGEKCGLQQAQGFFQSQHDIHVLNRLAGSSLAQIVDGGHDDEINALLPPSDVAEVGVGHVLHLRQLALGV